MFAVLGFLYVPLGRHTGFEHARAVFSTPAATAALEDLSMTALSLRQRALALFTGSSAAAEPPPPRAEPARSKPAPRPVVPKLK